MPAKDFIHETVKEAIIKDGWEITNDPYVISYGERFLFVDLGASSFIGIRQGNKNLAIEIKQFRSQSQIADLEQAIGQYTLYRLLLNQVDPERDLYLAVSEATYSDIFTEPIGKLVIADLPLKLIVVNLEKKEVSQWIPSRPIEKSSNR
ncbi:XisH family protein [Nodularia harveyana UHCC-0300]|uniref:XisH family protein n=1 Tax=Nodularia harveyana UHCC-0300 TaxID=2974287 RepID=A0ABU5UGN9_9CYAN|nr:XisH family protein [Nodularia harveyana]MEA5582649.1 XisH family protein [Nodularia harveyana UHCC-0300]